MVVEKAARGEVSPSKFVREAAKNDFLLSWSHGGRACLFESMIVGRRGFGMWDK
jgi:hypothetical protein